MAAVVILLLSITLQTRALVFSRISRTSYSSSSLHAATTQYGLLFDCDGVIVETEELHRVAYNKAFEFYGLVLPDGTTVEWSTAYYDILQNTVGGGKPKMNYFFNNDAKAWPISTRPYRAAPKSPEAKARLVDQLQDKKTECYIKIVENLAKARPGVLELMDEAISNPNVKVGICSAATRAGFEKIVDSVVGKERLGMLDIIIAGDDVKEKKPHPMIYNLARERLGLPTERFVVIEDSLVGLRSAKGAGMKCIITYTDSTATEDFYGEGADAKLSNLGGVTLNDIFGKDLKGDSLLEKFRDPRGTASDASGESHEAQAESKITGAAVSSPAAPVAVAYKGWTPAFMMAEDWKTLNK